MNDIGIFGLGVMGKSLAKNLSNKGFKVAVYNLPLKGEESVVTDFAAANPDSNFFPAKDLLQFVESLEIPRKILLMVKSGKPVDALISQLEPHLSKGDVVIDGGNSYFKDTIRREKALAAKEVFYVGMGVSGGEKGALLGPSMMPAGNEKIKKHLLPIFQKIAAKAEDEACVDWIGENGSGHFVKMVHNGIEYADMQILGETYSILKRVFGDNQTEMADYLNDWQNNTLHHSYLLETTLQILRYQENGHNLLPQILDVAGHKGTGLWTVKEGLDLGVPIPTIAAAMNSRITSAHRPLRIQLDKAKPSIQQNSEALQSIKNILPDAILAARLIALAEGFYLLSEASKTYDWNLSMVNIAKIWRGGCIIRSKMLPEIMAAFEGIEGHQHLFESPSFSTLLASKIPALEEVLEILVRHHCACPALSAALQYYHSLHEGYSPINLIQAQRDCFGAHGYQKLKGGKEVFHTEWEG